ncbi:MAG: ATP-binding cassette domain-containing protein [Rhodospirillaceae bacterium]|nr:ATP-binding cassette domain-containing protein [Rhodospirillaceae bacterium]
MLEGRDMRAAYGRIPALNGVSLAVAAGEAVGILGHNGMGKTTLLKTLMGYLPLKAGTLRFDGADIAREPTHRRARRGLAYVPQGREIFPFLTVAENLSIGAAGAAGLDEILADFPALPPLLARRGGALSGGQQQILAIARCMAMRPKCILLDEPTEGIQPSIVEEIAALLARLRTARGLALVVVEQRLEFIAGLADRALVMQKGTIVKEIPAAGLADRAAIEEIVGMGA